LVNKIPKVPELARRNLFLKGRGDREEQHQLGNKRGERVWFDDLLF